MSLAKQKCNIYILKKYEFMYSMHFKLQALFSKLLAPIWTQSHIDWTDQKTFCIP